MKKVWIYITVFLMLAAAVFIGRTFALHVSAESINEFVGTELVCPTPTPKPICPTPTPTPVNPTPTPIITPDKIPPDSNNPSEGSDPPVKGETTPPQKGDEPDDCALLPPHNGHYNGDSEDGEPILGAFDPSEHPKTADASDLKPLLAGLVTLTILLKLTIFGGKRRGG